MQTGIDSSRCLKIGIAMLILAAMAASLAAAQTPVAPTAPQLRFVWEEQVTLADDVPFGDTPEGKRNIVPITGGTFAGPELRGVIVPGGWDWQLTQSGGCFKLHADYMLRTDDGVMIHVINAGSMCPNSKGQKEALLTTPIFEAPKGKYDWLNGGAYIGTLEGMTLNGKRAVRIRFFKVNQN